MGWKCEDIESLLNQMDTLTTQVENHREKMEEETNMKDVLRTELNGAKDALSMALKGMCVFNKNAKQIREDISKGNN